jgi:short-subunit dehydrogenase
MIRAFGPILKQNGGGAIANMLSIASVVNVPVLSSYSASKAAPPIEVAKTVPEAIALGVEEVYPDPVSQHVFTNLKTPLKEAEKQFAGMLP